MVLPSNTLSIKKIVFYVPKWVSKWNTSLGEQLLFLWPIYCFGRISAVYRIVHYNKTYLLILNHYCLRLGRLLIPLLFLSLNYTNKPFLNYFCIIVWLYLYGRIMQFRPDCTTQVHENCYQILCLGYLLPQSIFIFKFRKNELKMDF